MEMESDSDEETQIHDIEQLTAALEADEPDINDISSQCSSLATSQNSASSKVLQEYSKIQAALALNKVTDEKLRRLEKILIGRLNECQQKLSEIQGSNSTLSEKQERQTFRYLNFGRPYFRDHSNFPAPDNADTIIMANSGMYDFSLVTSVPGWTVKDKTDFKALLLSMTQDLLKKRLNSKIAQLQRDSKGTNSTNLEKDLAIVKKEIEDLKKKTLNEIALPLHEEYDWEMVATKLNRRHSAQEYRALWKLFLHPAINKKTWTKAEHVALQDIAHNNRMQDWDKIAKELNTGRTGYQCFVYFRTNMSNTFTGQKWTKEEEEYLKRLIDYYREDGYIPWGKVAASMENRTKIQIYNKYARLIEKRKGRFLPEEDAVILTCVDNFGPNFKKVSKYLPGRSACQLRVRYKVLSRRTRTSTVWTIEEDKKLVQIMANQDASNYASLTKHFPGKDRINIRARYITLVKWMKKHPASDIAKAPRRGARRLCHGQASKDLNKAVESLRKRMESEVESKKPKRITENSSEEAIEDAIIVTLINENVKEEQLRKHDLMSANQSVLNEECIPVATTVNTVDEMINLRKTLILLKAQLDKDKFLDSSQYEGYRILTSVDQESCTVKIKSYSRKDSVKTILLKNTPDIWGNNVLSSTEYVFPPNYATITGCRKLMAYVSAKAPQLATLTSTNFSLLARRNVLFKEQLNCLMERFSLLFLWPMLLSNESPVHKMKRNVRRTKDIDTETQIVNKGGASTKEPDSNAVNDIYILPH